MVEQMKNAVALGKACEIAKNKLKRSCKTLS
jgi:hypothetical protein